MANLGISWIWLTAVRKVLAEGEGSELTGIALYAPHPPILHRIYDRWHPEGPSPQDSPNPRSLMIYLSLVLAPGIEVANALVVDDGHSRCLVIGDLAAWAVGNVVGIEDGAAGRIRHADSIGQVRRDERGGRKLHAAAHP